MAADIAAIERALLALAPDERVAVIKRGLLSLDEDRDQAGIDAAWRHEISRRVDAHAAGHLGLVDADEHFARIRTRLTAHDR